MDIFIHPNIHPLMFIPPPTSHKYCSVGPFGLPYAFAAVDSSSEISLLTRLACISCNAQITQCRSHSDDAGARA